MPANLVKPGQEDEWTKAKAIVKKNYPKIKEKSTRYWKIVTTIFKNLTKK